MRALALAVVAAVLLSGCGSGGTPAAKAPAPFDGDAAHGFVAGLVTDGSGEPRFRVPGTASHEEAAAWLWDQMAVAGWSRQWQNFTGAEYAVQDKDGVAAYYDSPAYCSPEEKARLAGLAFSNLWAVRDDPASDRLMLLGAHWESKRFANQDASGRQAEPVLGANDGASGVGVLLELMRHVQENGVDLGFDLGVAFFDGEDGFEDCHPLAGSIAFVSRLGLGQVDRFLLLDMVGDQDARFVVESRSKRCDPALAGLVQEHGASGPLAASFPGQERQVSDDHLPFIEAGIPAVDLIDYGRGDTRYGFPPYWHTAGDTMANIDAATLGQVGDLLMSVLADPAFTADWPAGC